MLSFSSPVIIFFLNYGRREVERKNDSVSPHALIVSTIIDLGHWALTDEHNVYCENSSLFFQ